MRIEILPARPEDVEELAARMRPADRAEVMASHGHSPAEALHASLASSTYAWTGWVDGQAVCMFGVAPVSLLAGRGAPWLLGTDRIEGLPRTFLRYSRRCVDAMLSVYPTLENAVDARNAVSIRWLRWLGFRIAPDAVTLPNGAQFYFFHRGP